MPLPLPAYESLGEMIQNSLAKHQEGRLREEQIKNALIKNKFAEPEAKASLEKKQLANKLYEPSTNADIASKTANANRMNFNLQNPLYGQAGMAGQLGAAELLRQNPNIAKDPNALKMLERSMQASLGGKESQNALQTKQASGYDFNSLPVSTKEYMLAQAAGMGIYPDEARKMLTSGKSLSDIALEKGFDPEDLPEPIYPLTKADQTQLKQRKASIAELNTLGKTISTWAGPYSQQIAGYSPLQVKDALTGKNKDQQAKFLAARMLAPEQAAIRIKAMGGNVGIEAIREMTEKSMMNGHALQALVKPDVFIKANELVEEAIKDAVDSANKAATKSIGSNKTGGNLIAEAAAVTPAPPEDLVQPRFPKNAKVMTYNPKTGRLE